MMKLILSPCHSPRSDGLNAPFQFTSTEKGKPLLVLKCADSFQKGLLYMLSWRIGSLSPQPIQLTSVRRSLVNPTTKLVQWVGYSIGGNPCRHVFSPFSKYNVSKPGWLYCAAKPIKLPKASSL